MSVNQTKTGFTLIEVLVSIMIISMATVAVMGAVQVNMKLSEDSEDDVIARFLAQDAVEYIQNIHDSKMIAYRNAGYDPTGIDWLGGLENCFVEDHSKGCKMNRSDGGDVLFSACDTSLGCEPLEYVPPFWKGGTGWIDGGQYRYGNLTGSTVSKFTRDITIQDADTATPDVPTAIEAIVTVKVSWKNRFGATKDVTYEKSLFNWIKGSVKTLAQVASDDFNRANGNLVFAGSNWSDAPDEGYNVTIVNTSRIRSSASGNGDASAYWNANAFDNDQYSEATVHTKGPYLGVTVRANGSDHVLGQVDDTYNNLYIYWYNGGSYTQIGTPWMGTVNVGDILRLEAEGNEYRLYQNNILRVSGTNSSAPSSGRPGVLVSGSVGRIDDWKGGNIEVSP